MPLYETTGDAETTTEAIVTRWPDVPTGSHLQDFEVVRLTIENATDLSPEAILALSDAQWWLMRCHPWLTIDIKTRGARDAE